MTTLRKCSVSKKRKVKPSFSQRALGLDGLKKGPIKDMTSPFKNKFHRLGKRLTGARFPSSCRL